jgi:hypothetical protein
VLSITAQQISILTSHMQNLFENFFMKNYSLYLKIVAYFNLNIKVLIFVIHFPKFQIFLI